MMDIGDRIVLHLDDYLATPQKVNRLNATAIDQDYINPQDSIAQIPLFVLNQATQSF